MRQLIFIFLTVSACAEFPALDGTISDAARDAPYPKLTRVPDLTGDAEPDPDELALQERLVALKERAERLREDPFVPLQ